MSLSPGTRLGPYEIEALLGEGGMGEVYRARDTRLGRGVAVKVLPADMNRDAGRVARFEREARAIAGLNHPNICALYDVAEHDGRAFLVMELLEGETLEQRLHRGPLDVDLVIDDGIALADALDLAHTRGLIHRDLKPANIFLTDRGQPKMLDFGIARVIERADDQTRVADVRLTGAGVAVGTVGYMSPEQLRGLPVDGRSDVFSLGVVLYEMATGRRAFTGDTPAVISAAILHEIPAPPRAVRPDLPPKLEEVILETLEKDRDLRCQSAAALRADLKRLKRTSAASAAPATAGTSAAAALSTSAPRTPISSDRQVAVSLAKRHPIALAAAAVVLLLLVVGGIWLARRPALSDGAPAAGTSLKLDVQPLTDTEDTAYGALSPDGRFVASVRRIDFQFSVWVRQLATGSDVQIVAPIKGRRFIGLSVTPDGSFVDFVATEPGIRAPSLWRVPFLGGPPTRIASDVWSATGWSPDGRHFAFIRTHADAAEDMLVVADADGSNERILETRRFPKRFWSDSNNINAPARPTWSPDGRQILAIGRIADQTPPASGHDLVIVDAATGAERRVQPVPFRLLETAWMDAAHALGNAYADDSSPSLRLFDLTDGSSTPVTQGVSVFVGTGMTPDRRSAVSTQFKSRSSLWMGGAAGNDLIEVVPESSSWISYLNVANDGTLAYTAATLMGGFGVNVSQPAARAPRAVLAPGDDWPNLRGDGRTIVFARGGKDAGIYIAAIDGTGLTRLVEGNVGGGNVVLTPDGTTVLFTLRTGDVSQALWSAPASGGPGREIAHRFVSRGSISVSPDSRHVVFSSARPTPTSPTPRILCDLPDCTNPREVQWPSGVWTPDRRGIAFVDNSVDPKNIQVQQIDGGKTHPLTHFTDKQVDAFAWSPDGQRLVIARSTRTADIVLIKGFAGAR